MLIISCPIHRRRYLNNFVDTVNQIIKEHATLHRQKYGINDRGSVGHSQPGVPPDNPEKDNRPIHCDAPGHYADEWKYSDGTGQNRNPNDDKSGILADLSPDAVQNNG